MASSKKSPKKSSRRINKRPVQSGSSRLLNDALTLAKTFATSQKDRGMERFDFLIERTRDYASSLKTMPVIQDQIDYIANSLNHFSDYIEKTEFDTIAIDAKKFVARNPALTIGLATIVGLAAFGWATANVGGRKGKPTKNSGKKSGSLPKLAASRPSRSNGHASTNS